MRDDANPSPEMQAMLDEASAALLPTEPSGPLTPELAPVAITVESFPGLCMGASMLMSLGMAKVGFAALTESEGKALTAALLKNAEAWDLGNAIRNPKIAAGLDLGGCVVAILVPRIIADLKAQPSSPTQMAAADVDQPSQA